MLSYTNQPADRRIIVEKVQLLDFDEYGGGSCPVQYEVNYNNDYFYIRYRHSWLSIEKNDDEIFFQQLAPESWNDGYWSDKETNVYLMLISQAIISNSFEILQLPIINECRDNEYYRFGKYPFYSIGKKNISAKDLTDQQKSKNEHYYSKIRDKQGH